MENMIKNIFTNLGADACGIAGIEKFEDTPAGFHPKEIYKDCKSAIVFAKRIPKGTAFVNPRIVYNKAIDINVAEIDVLSYKASIEIEKINGAVAVPIPSDAPYEYWDAGKKEGKGIISMRHAAMLGGIGSMGKNTLIINEKYGNMINIGLVLTNLELKSDPLSEKMCIEGCNKCIDNCPAKALDGIAVNQKLCREFAYGTNERGFGVVNCNKCRIGCPRVFGKGE